jgi:hypothetical protein
MIFIAPTIEEYRSILDEYPFDEDILSLDNFQYTIHPEGGIENFHASREVQTWIVHLKNRMYQTRWSWVQLSHFYNKGIPDDEWFISPGRNGESVEYFPHFNDNNHEIKAQFNYFADVFYYKLFSAWDNLGHIINNMYGLSIRKADFHKAVKRLRTVRLDLYNNLNGLIESEDFEKMRAFRHSSTHNELIGHLSSGSTKVSDNIYDFGIGEYTTSSQIKNNADKSMNLIEQAIKFIIEQVQSDR